MRNAGRADSVSASKLRQHLVTILLAALVGYSSDARADSDKSNDLGASMFSFSGFGTVGAVHSSENRADFTSSTFNPNGAGYTRAWSATVDSRIGAQLSVNFTSRISAVLQVISEQRYDNTFKPTVEWANVRFQVTPDLSIRAGRIVLPTFLESDTVKVGYTYPWVRPPIEVYGLAPVTNSDGVDVSYRLQLGRFVNTIQAAYGNKTAIFPDGLREKANGLWSAVISSEYGPMTVHLSAGKQVPHLIFHITLDDDIPDSLLNSFRQFGAEGIAIADRYTFNSKSVLTFVALGANYEPGDWFVKSEWSQINTHSTVGRKAAWYVSSGFRFGQVTPFLTYAELQRNSRTSDPGLTLTNLTADRAAAAAALNAILNDDLRAAPVQKTISVGARWDFMKNVALKLQYDRTRLGANSPGTLINVQPNFQPGGTVNLFSATIDFVL